ncbi:MAG: membrane protein insertase YidC [Gammaproteobacteria bacterium]
MANPRLYLFIALCFVALLLFQAWEKDYGPKSPPVTTSAPTQPAQKTKAASAPAKAPASPSAAQSAVPSAVPAAGGPEKTQQPAAGPAEPLVKSKQAIHVRTDVLDVRLDTQGGDVRQVDLRKYTVSIKDKKPFELMTDRGPGFYVAQSGFTGPHGAIADAPNHKSLYTADKTDYTLAPGQDTLQVHLHWSSPTGIEVTKTYTFKRGSYVVGLDYQVKNNSGKPWQASFYRQLQRTEHTGKGTSSRFIHTYLGTAYYTPSDHYKKESFSDMKDKALNVTDVKGGWVAMLQHYFLGAWIPDSKSTDTFYADYLPKQFHTYRIGAMSPLQTVAPGSTRNFKSRLFVGPKLQDRLASITPGLELTVDYGILTVISKPLFWLLEKLHKFFGNWGWSIIVLTILIKLAFYKLSETSYRSMAKMRRVQPRMKALKERYGDDRQKMNQALMELYKTEKINPLGGCLPIVIQIPVFIALYWVLLYSVEMRQAPFILWIHDLSAPDPYFVLPLLMGVTMLIQQRLNPAPMDPLQQKIMMLLPLVFTVFFAFFPAGLVVYWVVNNTLSIAQQYVITKRVNQAAAKT